jgi:hypothetical protein
MEKNDLEDALSDAQMEELKTQTALLLAARS